MAKVKVTHQVAQTAPADATPQAPVPEATADATPQAPVPEATADATPQAPVPEATADATPQALEDEIRALANEIADVKARMASVSADAIISRALGIYAQGLETRLAVLQAEAVSLRRKAFCNRLASQVHGAPPGRYLVVVAEDGGVSVFPWEGKKPSQRGQRGSRLGKVAELANKFVSKHGHLVRLNGRTRAAVVKAFLDEEGVAYDNRSYYVLQKYLEDKLGVQFVP